MSSRYFERPLDQIWEKSDGSYLMSQNHVVDDGRRPFFALPAGGGASFLSTTASGVVGCLTGLATCQPSSSDGSHAAVAEPSFDQFTSSRAIPVEEPSSNLDPLSTNRHVAPPVENWLANDQADFAQNLQNYPALQPTVSAPMAAQLLSVQPNTRSESMCYPNDQSPTTFSVTEKTEATDTTNPILASMPPLPSWPAELPIGAICTEDTSSTAVGNATHFSPPVLPETAAAMMSVNASSTIHETNLLSSPIEDEQTSPPTSSPTAASYYPPTSQPVHHHHHLQNQLPVTSYMGETSMHLTVQPHPRPLAARRGPFKDHVERQKTAQTRKIGSCIRCRMQRIRCNCDPSNVTGECLGCKKSLSRTWRLPCMRLKISDVVLSKTSQVKGHEWTLRWKENTVLDDVGQWASSEVRTIRITEGYTNDYVELRVRRFVPQDGDRLDRSWVTPSGEMRSVTIPPYAIIEPESIGPHYNAYIKKGLVACCNHVLGDHKGTLIWPTYWTAINLSRRSTFLSEQERTLLSNTLELWMSVRLTTRSFELIGDETLGMPPNILDETSPSHGKIPIPPVLGAQLDSVLIHQIQNRLRHDALDGLHKLITENKARTWFTSYLVIFILLHNAALVLKHDASYARKHGIQSRFARQDKVQQYYTGAITLLAYFHYCNKGVFPFTEDAKDQDIRNLANLDETSMQFVRHTRKYAIANKKRWQALWETNAYEDDFYFISQLFEVNWQPRPMVF
ncbi:hypothetical protein SPI_00684 [Niveomyces insectorum RCEF 264]|uniref:Zn(2)-C6 fungal-type domain-containing protein n=1 Tax=Niveomyces insectorum RCEF 264 TaxID=1081102 RepID=A0A162MQG7_9HYPO|nr:hypothetical protein SPI_00684 [Niveomyces insectorum RCEF 264]